MGYRCHISLSTESSAVLLFPEKFRVWGFYFKTLCGLGPAILEGLLPFCPTHQLRFALQALPSEAKLVELDRAFSVTLLGLWNAFPVDAYLVSV